LLFFRKYPASVLLIFWLIGLIISDFTHWNEKFVFVLSTLVLILSVITYFIGLKRRIFAAYFILLSILLFFLAGNLYGELHQIDKHHKHVVSQLPADVLEIKFRIKKQLPGTDYYRRYVAEIREVNTNPIEFKVLLQIQKDSAFYPFPGREYIYHPQPGEWRDLPPPSLPFGFDYSHYLKSHGIYYKLNLKYSSNVKTGHAFFPGPVRYRTKIREGIFHSMNDSLSARILSALLLGERYLLDRDIKHSFVNAGVVHVLAISGLHVGILLLFLRIMFRPFRRKKLIYNLLIIGILWFYAALIGFPVPVTRAVLMFSLFQIGYELKRRTSPYYILLLSGFLILLIAPRSWKDTGFLLSFTAVLSILIFYPFLKRIYYPHSKTGRYLIDLVYVSIAAQIGLLPLLFLFFHRFSFGFLFANLLVIPLVTIILITGFLMLPFWAMGIRIPPVTWILTESIDWMLLVINRISAWDFLIFENIYFSPWTALALGIWIYALYVILKEGRKGLSKFLVVLWLGAIFLFVDKYRRTVRQQVVLSLYHYQPVIDLLNGEKLSVYSDTSIHRNHFENYKKYLGVTQIKKHEFPRIFDISGKKYFLIKESFPDSLLFFKTDVLILQNSPHINLDLWLNRLKPQEVVSAGNNYNYLKRRWEESCRKRGIEYTDLTREGYKILYRSK